MLGSIAVLASLAIWIFLTFYFERTLNKVVIPKIEQAALKATHGRFALTLDKISYADGTLICNTFILSRIAYEDSDHGIVLERMTLDTARFEGISWWDILWQKDLTLTSLELNAPKIYMIDIDTGTRLPIIPEYVIAKTGDLSDVPVISFDSIVLRNISVFLPMESGNDMIPAYRNITIKLTNFSLDPEAASREPMLFSKNVNFELPGGNYPVGDSTYSIEVRGIRGSFSDSLCRRSIALRTCQIMTNRILPTGINSPQGRLEFQCAGLANSWH